MQDLRKYWQERGKQQALNRDPFETICCSGRSILFNRACDHVQAYSFERLLLGEEKKGRRILEVGCGIGRWTKYFRESFYFGIDISESMLRNAKAHSPKGIYLNAMGSSPPFKKGMFDMVYSVTVLQHMLPEQQEQAAKEMVRVTKPGGKILLMEDTLKRNHAPTEMGNPAPMHAKSPEEWITMFEKQGVKLVYSRRDKYFAWYSLYKRLKKLLARINIEIDDTFVEKFFYYLSLSEPYLHAVPPKLASGICLKFIK